MSLALKDTIAEAVKTGLNAGPLVTLGAAATRKHAFESKLEDIQRINDVTQNPIVTVYPLAERKVRTSRTTYAREVDVGICLQCRCKFTDATRADELSVIVEAITEYIGTAGKMGGAAFMSLEIDPIFDPTILREEHVFQSNVQLTYRIGS